MQSELLILAHRGGMSRAPENTILSFEQALTDGADAFECDVCLTQDKEPVMIHVDVKKNSIQEATGALVPVSDLPWSEVKKLKMVNTNEPVPHLDQVLDFVKSTSLYCWLEPKTLSIEIIDIVVDKIQRFGLVDLVGILTFYSRRDLLTHTKFLNPRIKTSVLLINPLSNFLRQVSYIGADHVVFGWNGPNQFQFHNAVFQSFTQKVQKLRASEVQVEGGYVRTKNDVQWLLRHGVGGLWADDVPKIRSYAESYFNRYM